MVSVKGQQGSEGQYVQNDFEISMLGKQLSLMTVRGNFDAKSQLKTRLPNTSSERDRINLVKFEKGFTMRCRLFGLTISVLVYKR